MEYSLFFDNLLSLLPLFDQLSKKSIGGTETIWSNCIGKSRMVDQSELKKMPLRLYCYASDPSGILLTRWHDNSIVTLASNRIGIAPLSVTQRWSQSDKRKQRFLYHL